MPSINTPKTRAAWRGLMPGYTNLLTASRAELDLEDGPAVQCWFAEYQPTVVVLAAAKVGGIQANNSYPADFLLENLKIQTHVIEIRVAVKESVTGADVVLTHADSVQLNICNTRIFLLCWVGFSGWLRMSKLLRLLNLACRQWDVRQVYGEVKRHHFSQR